MAGWGALGGLGQGLTNASGMILDHNKEKMRNKLELEREGRQEQRQKDKEAREQAQFSGQYRTDFANGVRYKLNKAGETMGEPEPIPSHELNQFNRTERIAGVEEKILGHDLTVKGAQAGVAGELAGLTVEEKRATIRARDASADASRASAQNSRSSAAARGSGAKTVEDARSAGLDSYTVQSFFSKKDKEGNPILDDEGKVETDYNALEAYLSSPEYQAAKDKNAGAARFMGRRVPEIKQERTARGASAGFTGGELEQFIKTGSSPSTRSGEANPADVETIQKAERNAITAIDSGKITVEEAAAQMEAKGHVRAAARLRARYGN